MEQEKEKFIIQEVEYIGSYPSEKQCPQANKPEYAFIGRSNVGKSSLINMLTGRKDLARVSKKPGKTQYLNYYLVNKSWYIVDLPGYGYAHISKKKRQEWEKMIEGFLIKRATLQCAVVLVDSNIPPQKIDVEFMNWLGKMQIPFVICYTKTDRVKPHKLEENLQAIRNELLKYWNELPQQFVTSSNNGIGRAEILSFIKAVNSGIF